MLPADEQLANDAFVGWLREFMNQSSFPLGAEALKAAFMAGAEWADETLR